MENFRPSRSRMQQEKAKQEAMKEGDLKIKTTYDSRHPSILAVPVATTTKSFLDKFCQEHELTYTEKNGYYHIT